MRTQFTQQAVPRRRATMVLALLSLLWAGAVWAEPSFLPNRGQWDGRALYRLRLPGGQVWFTRDAVVYDLWDSAGGGHVLRQELGAQPRALEGSGRVEGDWSFIRPGSTVTDVQGVREVWYRDLHPGISLRYYVEGGGLKYDVLAAPGADLGKLRMRWRGARSVRALDGGVVVKAGRADLRENPPVAWQVDSAGERQTVECRYRVSGESVGYTMGVYNRRLPLVVDPAITFGTYVGGDNAEAGRGVSVDSAGNIYIAGTTRSENFPTTTGAYRPTITSFNGASDLFVAKYDPTGTVLLFGTYIGGRGSEEPSAIRVVSRRATPGGPYLPATILVAGTTYSIDFPTTLGVRNPTHLGGADGFLLGLAPDGRSLLYSTFIGGESDDFVTGLDFGNFENPYVCGWTRSLTLPASASFVDGPGATGEDAFIARYSARLDTLKWMVRYGGLGSDHAEAVVVEPGGAAWATGWTLSSKVPVTDDPVATTNAGGADAFVLRVRFNGSALDYATMIGGSGDDIATAIAVDTVEGGNTNRATITGRTTSGDYPLYPSGIASTGGSWFVTRLRYPFSPMAYSRTLGVADSGGGEAVVVEPNGEAVLAGTTTSLAFPTTGDATLVTPRGARDLVVMRLSADGGTVRHAAVIGGSGEDSVCRTLVLQRPGSVILAGTTFSSNFPVIRPTHDNRLNAAGSTAQPDAYVLRYGLDRRPSIHSATRHVVPTVRCDTVALDTLIVRNLGDAELTITGHRFSTSAFKILSPTIGTSPLRVPAGDSIRYIVSIRFTSADALSDTLEITSNDSTPGKRPLRVAYNALRAPVKLQAQPSSVAFPPTLACGGLPGEKPVLFSNVGKGSVVVTSISLLNREPSFTIGTAPNTPLFLAQGAGMSVRVIFSPVGRGVHRDTLVVRVAECPTPFLVPLVGVGDSAALLLPVHTVELGEIASCRLPLDTALTLLNTGTVTLNLSAFTSDAGLLLRGAPFPDSVVPSASRDLPLRVKPSGLGAFRSVLYVQGSPCGVQDSIVVTGVVREGPQVEVPTRLALDSVAGCGSPVLSLDTSIVLVNQGGEIATVDTLDFPDLLDRSALPPFPLTLNPGASVRLPLALRGGAGAFDISTRFVAEVNGCRDTLPFQFDGVLVRALPAVEPVEVSVPSLQGCDISHDTTVLLRNPWPFPLTIERAESGGAARSLDTFPLTLAPRSTSQLRVRYAPLQSGVTIDTLLLFTAGCGDTLRVRFSGQKQGVLVRAVPEEVSLSLLSCQGSAARVATVQLRNDGDGPSATVESVVVEGGNFLLLDDVRGVTITKGAEVPVRLSYEGNGRDIGALLVVLGPCGDTLRVPIGATLETLPRVVLQIDVGNVGVGDDLRIDTSFLNPVGASLMMASVSGGSGELSLDSFLPAPPSVLGVAEAVRLALRVRPVGEGAFSDTVWVRLSEPCVDSIGVVVRGSAGSPGSDTLRFCMDEAAAGSAGDTLSLRLDADRRTTTADSVVLLVGYDAPRLALLDARTAAGVPVRVEDNRGTATLVLPPGDLAQSLPIAVRFLLLAGRGGAAHARVDSAYAGGIPAAACADDATVIVADRCLVTGVVFGRYASLLEPVHPSPARDVVEVTWQQLEDAVTTIRLVDASGREQLRALDVPLPGGRYTVQVPLEDVPSGWYLLLIEAGEWRAARQVYVTQ